MAFIGEDYQWMSRALQLAERGRYSAKPNPCVGCVIVKAGTIVGEGAHLEAGMPHAEVNAITAAGVQTQGATAYVTLEPCNHQGRTGPCTQALIAAGVSRVVFALLDPNPLVSGQGAQALLDAGLVVDGPFPVFEAAAREINKGFLSRMERQRPWVRCKMAISLDGRTALANGESKWITSADARRDVQRWRARSSAIITGVNSVLEDNSRLNLREGELILPPSADLTLALKHAPLRVVLDTHLRLPLTAEILDASAPTLVLSSEAALVQQVEKISAIEHAGHSVEAVATNAHGQLCLQQVLALLAQKGCNEVLVEAGASLAGSFLEAGLLDELVIYQAPVLLGSGARSMMNFSLSSMAEKWQLDMVDQRRVGVDQRMIARIAARSDKQQ